MNRAIKTALATVLALAATAAPAAAISSDPDGSSVDPPADPKLPPRQAPTAKASFALAPRADASRTAWSTSADNYGDSYVHPSRWVVLLDGCGSWGGTDSDGNVQPASFEWRLQPLDGQAEGAHTVTSNACKAYGLVHELGRWRAALTVRAPDGRSATADAGSRRLRDVVIVAFGDSYVAGEGNPEEPAQWDGGPGHLPHVRNSAKWSDAQCHRSRASWAMRAAQRFEDRNTAVTFLNYACSGATTDDLMKPGYDGIEPRDGDRKLPAQLAAAQAALGGQFDDGSRPVHTALMSIGVNDLGFSDLLQACAAFNAGDGFHIDIPELGALTDEPCSTAGLTRWVDNGILQLEEQYDRLEVGIAANLNARSVRIVQYPSRVMTNGRDHHTGCGMFKGISPGEARWITRGGDKLNNAMQLAAARNGWGYVSGIRDAFRHHGYCAGDTWFRSFSGSVKLQGNIKGTAHPMWAGHAAAGDIVAGAIPSEEQPLPPPARIRIELERVRVYTPPSDVYTQAGDAPLINPMLSVMWHGWHEVPVSRRQYKNGSWINVPEADRTTVVETRGNTIGVEGSVTLPALRVENDTGREERSGRRYISTGPRRARFFVTHRRADGWSPGEHTINGGCEKCSLQVQYRVTVLPWRSVSPNPEPVAQSPTNTTAEARG